MKLLSRIEHYHCSLLYCSSFLESLKFSKIKLACRTSFTEFWRKFLIKRANKTKKLSEYGRLESEKFKGGYSTPRLPHVPISSHLNSLIVSCILFFSLMFTPAVQPFSFSRLPVITVMLFIISPPKIVTHCTSSPLFLLPLPLLLPPVFNKEGEWVSYDVSDESVGLPFPSRLPSPWVILLPVAIFSPHPSRRSLLSLIVPLKHRDTKLIDMGIFPGALGWNMCNVWHNQTGSVSWKF